MGKSFRDEGLPGLVKKAFLMNGTFHPGRVEFIGDSLMVEVCGSKTNSSYLGEFHLSRLPGCCGAIVFHSVVLVPDVRGKGYGTALLKLRERVAELGGYSLLMATVQTSNKVERHILKKAGWTCIKRFRNVCRGGNRLQLWVKYLYPDIDRLLPKEDMK